MSFALLYSKPLEGKPCNFSQKIVMAKANASALTVHGKGDQRLFSFLWMDVFISMWRRGFTTLNKQLFGGNRLSFSESTAYRLIFKLYTKQYFWVELAYFLILQWNKCSVIREVTNFFSFIRLWLEGIQLQPEANNKYTFLPITLCFINTHTPTLNLHWRKIQK